MSALPNDQLLPLYASTISALSKEPLILGTWIKRELDYSFDNVRYQPERLQAAENQLARMKAGIEIEKTAIAVHYTEVLGEIGEVLLGEDDRAAESRVVKASKEMLRNMGTYALTIRVDREQRSVDPHERVDPQVFERIFSPRSSDEERKRQRTRFLEGIEDDAGAFGWQEIFEYTDEVFELYRTTIARRLHEKIRGRVPLHRIEAFWYNHVFGLYMYALLLVEAQQAPRPDQIGAYASTAFRRLNLIARETEQFAIEMANKIILNE